MKMINYKLQILISNNIGIGGKICCIALNSLCYCQVAIYLFTVGYIPRGLLSQVMQRWQQIVKPIAMWSIHLIWARNNISTSDIIKI